jgi:hypothetical protein
LRSVLFADAAGFGSEHADKRDDLMGFLASAGRIHVTNAAGETRLDTDEKLFHIVPPDLSDTINIAARSRVSGQPAIAEVNDTLLGSCHPDCTHVIGAVKLASSSAFGIGFDRWTTYMGGDLVWAMTSIGQSASTIGQVGPAASICVLYSFFIDDGDVYLRQRIRLNDKTVASPATLTIAAHDITYMLKCGLFT